MYDWVLQEVASVRTRKFFIIGNGCSPTEMQAIEQEFGKLPDDYRAFLQQFGGVRLFRDSTASIYYVEVFAKPRSAEWLERNMLMVGSYITDPVYLRAGGDTAVYACPMGRTFRVGNCFSEWFSKSFAKAKRKFSKSGWKKIVEGPKPFDQTEESIVRALQMFHVRKVGVAPNGNVLFEVHNESDRTLPYFSVGVRVPGKLEGGVYLPVSDILPGQKKIVEYDCYQSLVNPADVQVFKDPPPGPEDRLHYWEFGKPQPRPSRSR